MYRASWVCARDDVTTFVDFDLFIVRSLFFFLFLMCLSCVLLPMLLLPFFVCVNRLFSPRWAVHLKAGTILTPISSSVSHQRSTAELKSRMKKPARTMKRDFFFWNSSNSISSGECRAAVDDDDDDVVCCTMNITTETTTKNQRQQQQQRNTKRKKENVKIER